MAAKPLAARLAKLLGGESPVVGGKLLPTRKGRSLPLLANLLAYLLAAELLLSCRGHVGRGTAPNTVERKAATHGVPEFLDDLRRCKLGEGIRQHL